MIKPKKICQHCGGIYECRQRSINRSKYCSVKCQVTALGIKTSENRRSKWNQDSPEEALAQKTKSFKRFFLKTDGCWIWKGHQTGRYYKKRKGYGSFSFRGRTYKAHRFSYEIYKGPIPKGKFIMHICDMPPCVNPDHLVCGSARENNIDKVRKKRTSIQKLVPEEAQKIKDMLIKGIQQSQIARDMKVSRTTITSIKKGRTWGWIK